MATSPLLLIKTSYHARSISLPSRSNPLTLGVEEQLQRLKSSEEASSSSSQQLSGLRSLYDSVDDLLHMSHTQNALSQFRSEECVNEVLDGSLRVLDVCNTARDVLLETKGSVQGLLSSLRRKRGADPSLAKDISEYMICKKKLNKFVHKCIGDLKKMEINKKHVSSSALLEMDPNLVAIVCIMREVNAVTVSIFKSLISSSVSQPRRGGWSLVSKLMYNSKKVACDHGEETEYLNDMAKVDAALSVLMTQKSCQDENGVLNTQNALKQMEIMDMSIHGLEEELESVFRSLIKTRVSLLNSLNH